MGRFLAMWAAGGIGVVALLAILTGLTLSNSGWFGYLQLARHGAPARGTIVRTVPEQHCSADYTFEVSGRTYSGGAADCAAVVGQEVDVTYLVGNPAQSCLGSAWDRLANELAAFFAGAILLPPLVIWRFGRMRSRQRS